MAMLYPSSNAWRSAYRARNAQMLMFNSSALQAWAEDICNLSAADLRRSA